MNVNFFITYSLFLEKDALPGFLLITVSRSFFSNGCCVYLYRIRMTLLSLILISEKRQASYYVDVHACLQLRSTLVHSVSM